MMEMNIQHVSMIYPNGKQALKDLSLSLRSPSLVGLLGPNGAGKSTTMNIITGYLSSTEGTVTIDGSEILEDPIGAKSKIGYLPEIPPRSPFCCDFFRYFGITISWKVYNIHFFIYVVEVNGLCFSWLS